MIDTRESESEAIQLLRDDAAVNDITITDQPSDNFEEQAISEFILSGCGCSKGLGKPCCQQFPDDYIRTYHLNCIELTHSELDMIILGQLAACVNSSSVVSTVNRHAEREREKSHKSFTHQGKPICNKMFRFLHGIGEKRLKSFEENGITPRIHSNVKRRLKHALSYTSTQFVVRFIFNYAEQHALLLPGRIPGYRRSDIQLLPSSVSKRSIWKVYQAAAQAESTIHPVAYSTFCYLWRKLTPSIIIMKPRSDLCWKCHQNSTSIIRTANQPEAEKSAAIADAQEHLAIVRKERALYKSICKDCKESVRAHFVSEDTFLPPASGSCIPLNCHNIKVHYSFDYAQQVHYPSDPLQPGPIYFLTPRKCTIFGVNCEAIPRQVNFLTDEAGECGKGANAVVSRLHYFFDHHGLGEKDVYLHADNCTGQNKNSCMIQYLLWRTLTSRHTNITLSFLPVGHTKFAPNWCFGLFKRGYRRTKVGTLQSIAEVVNNSAECNIAQVVSHENGRIVVPSYNWTDFFATRMKKIIGIKRFHHFRMVASSPGVVFVKHWSDSSEEEMKLTKETCGQFEPTELPTTINPPGLSLDRQWYLYESIRPFCTGEDKDIVCPLPSAPKPSSRGGTPVPACEDDNENQGPPPERFRGVRVCSICHKEGHNRQTCPSK